MHIKKTEGARQSRHLASGLCGRGSPGHVYDDTWLQNFGLVLLVCLSVAKHRRSTLGEKVPLGVSKSAWKVVFGKLRGPESVQSTGRLIRMLTYDLDIPVIHHGLVKVALCELMSCHSWAKAKLRRESGVQSMNRMAWFQTDN